VIVQEEAVKLYAAAVEALRKKGKTGYKTHFTTKN
jgi:hypothetical protein